MQNLKGVKSILVLLSIIAIGCSLFGARIYYLNNIKYAELEKKFCKFTQE